MVVDTTLPSSLFHPHAHHFDHILRSYWNYFWHYFSLLISWWKTLSAGRFQNRETYNCIVRSIIRRLRSSVLISTSVCTLLLYFCIFFSYPNPVQGLYYSTTQTQPGLYTFTKIFFFFLEADCSLFLAILLFIASDIEPLAVVFIMFTFVSVFPEWLVPSSSYAVSWLPHL